MSEETSSSEIKALRRKKIVKWVFWRIPIFLMIFGAILIGALKIVEGYPDPLRQGFEQYLSEATGRNATIGRLEEVKFFPEFIIHANNITIHNRANAAVIDLEVESFKISAPFTSVFVGNQKINDISIVNLKANKDMFGPKEVMVEQAGIVVKEEGENPGSFVIGNGLYGEDKLNFELQLEVGKYNYYIPRNMPILISIGDYSVQANFIRNMKKVALENTIFTKNTENSTLQDYVISKKEGSNIDNPLTCILTQENLQLCDKYLTNEAERKEN